MISLLFVDDEPRVLDGLRRLLRNHRQEWETTFALGGREAMNLLQSQRFDVVVSDMRMPEIDGAAVLRQAQIEQPQAVRIVLSGHTELETAMRTVGVAHQFLTKPCDAAVLQQVVQRACSLRAVLSDAALQEAVGGVESLPSAPQQYQAVVQAMADPNSSLDEIGSLVERDTAVSAKVLQLVNSSFFGVARRVTDIRRAVGILGLNLIRALILSEETGRIFGAKVPPDVLSLADEQRHAMKVASLARKILHPWPSAADALVAGMLHDAGKLVLAVRMPEYFRELSQEAKASGKALYVVEAERRSLTHADVGAYLLGIWGLPDPIVEAVAHHHQPSRLGQPEAMILLAVHVADALVSDPSGDCGRLDLQFVKDAGVEDRLPEWRAVADELAAGSSEEAL